MPKKRQKTTIIKEEEEIRQDENPLSKLIKNFFDTGELHPDLDECQFEIRVMKWDYKRGKYATLHGVHFNDLEGMMDVLGEKYGDARYKFYVKAKNAEGKIIAGAIIEDYDLIWGGETQPEDDDLDYDDMRPEPPQNGVIELMKEQIKAQNNLLIEMIKTQKGGAAQVGPGMKDILEILETGIHLGQGRDPENSDMFDKLANGPLGQVLAAVLTKNLITPPQTTPPKTVHGYQDVKTDNS